MKPDPQSDTPETGISFATWQDRQLAVLLARSNQLLSEIRAGNLAMESRSEALSKEIGRTSALLEAREAELARATSVVEARDGEVRRIGRERDALQAAVAGWQAKADVMDRELADLRGREQRLREEVARLEQVEREVQTLSWKVSATAAEAANLRRHASELENSLSWKITAPLRAITRPLFRLMAPAPAPAGPTVGAVPATGGAPAAGSPPAQEGTITVFPVDGAAAPGPLHAILPHLRRAQSIAIIPCAIPFGATLNQRPISCARYLADHGTTVLYVAWQWQPDEQVPRAWEEVYPGVFHIPLYGFLSHVESIAAASHGKSSYLCTLPSPGLVEMVRPLRAAGYHIHFDIMDDWEGFHRGGEAPWFVAEVEHELVILADTVSAVSERLAEKFGHLRSDIAVVRNGYQPAALGCEQFVAARTPLGERKMAGYFGHFSDAWFHWDAVIHAARERPDIDFELIGWGISEATRQRLDALPNIRPIGIVPQGELHRHARNWWLGMIPFQPTEVSRAVDPLKVYEYLHLGLPTVVTGISGIASYPLVEYAGDSDSFVTAIDRVTARPDEQRLAEVAEFLKDCVWDRRFQQLNQMLTEPAGLASLYAR